MSIPGYLSWGRRTYRQVWLDGALLRAVPASTVWQRAPDDVAIRMADGGHVHQRRISTPDAPAGVAPFSVTFDVLLREQDFIVFREAQSIGRPVAFFPEWWHVDVWRVELGGSGRTTWRTSRRTPWENVAGVTKTTHPPEVYLDGVAQTLVASAPSAGEAVVPDANDIGAGNNAAIVTPSLAGSDRLRLVYAPEYLVRIDRLTEQAVRVNELRASLSVSEILLAEWSAA